MSLMKMALSHNRLRRSGTTGMLMLGCCCLALVSMVQGHGRLMSPAARSTLWRAGFPGAVTNYNDNELNCGGREFQEQQGGKCGICGDPWTDPVTVPRDHEAGGKYAKGIIAKHCTAGQTLPITVQVTANHKGWFEFRLCPVTDPTVPVTLDCLNQGLLPLADGSGTRYELPSHESKNFTAEVKLPAGLTCEQCVLQWKWRCGNNWGNIAQEEFYGCADIQITGGDGNGQQTSSTTTSTTTTSTAAPSSTTTTTTAAPPSTTTTTTAAPSSTTTTTSAGGEEGTEKCVSTGAYEGAPGMDNWCRNNCPGPTCVATHCRCYIVTSSTSSSTSTTVTPSSTASTTTTIITPSSTASTSSSTTITPSTTVSTTSTATTGSTTGSSSSPTVSTTTVTTTPSSSCIKYASKENIIFLNAICRVKCSASTTECPEFCECVQQGVEESKTRCRAAENWKQYNVVDRYCKELCSPTSCPNKVCQCDP